MAESAALLVDEVFPEQPVRQWVLSVPYEYRQHKSGFLEFAGIDRVIARGYLGANVGG